MKNIKLISILAGIILVGGAYFWWFSSRPEGSSALPFELNWFGGSSNEPAPSEGNTAENSPTPENPGANPLTPQKSSAEEYAKLLQERGKIYEDFDVFFRFLYPPDFNATEIDDEKGYTILVQNAAKDAAFQVFMYPFDEPGPITAERVRKDMPNLKIENPQQVLIGADKNIQALIFFSEEQALGRTREVWFVGNGHLFQVETYADQDSVIGPVLSTWQFLAVN